MVLSAAIVLAGTATSEPYQEDPASATLPAPISETTAEASAIFTTAATERKPASVSDTTAPSETLPTAVPQNMPANISDITAKSETFATAAVTAHAAKICANITTPLNYLLAARAIQQRNC